MDSRWHLSTLPWKSEILLPFDMGEDHRFFHVTSHASSLEQAGAYRSRYQLRKQGLVGLGGSHRDAPQMVSFVVELDSAQRILTAIRSMARTIHGQMAPSSLVQAMLEWLDFPDSESWKTAMGEHFGFTDFGETDYNEETQEFLHELASVFFEINEDQDLENLLSGHGWRDLLVQQGPEMDKRLRGLGPERIYDSVRGFENLLVSSFGSTYQNGDFQPGTCLPVVGFVAPFDKFFKIQPDDVSITQAAVRDGAEIQTNEEECELRIHPDDLQLIALRVEERGPVSKLPPPERKRTR